MLMALQDAPDIGASAPAPQAVAAGYAAIRAQTLGLIEGLAAEDCQAQSMPEASPAKWHLAHTTWFFETFVLALDPEYRPSHRAYTELFNSYYHSVGALHPRGQRGLLTRPTLDEVRAWRAVVDDGMLKVLEGDLSPEQRARVELGLHHEQQHQELLLADLKHLFWHNPLRPAYRDGALPPQPTAQPWRWLERPGVMVEIGHGAEGFAFDNETPRHRAWVDAHVIASRPVNNGEYLDFIVDGGYRNPLLWLADGWDAVQAGDWQRPLYWDPDCDTHFTLRGERTLEHDEPVCHLSYYEADAFARWAGARLPREEEWEAAAQSWPVAGNLLDSGLLQPRSHDTDGPSFYGDVWQWCASSYAPYPGYQATAGALGEYNAKFMCNQMVLRGGSCVTPAGHLRASYRNFFAPHARWQFSGARLAKDRV
ncbi:MAG TPA: ergothioneine biosynthesis protein EgtB [Verrucomicrobiae bacterium]|nr:ergothioneine biosynthesis protein EgtB [Verrucomicrobiae bacterium]